jgi:hypothetical protein
MKIRTLLLGSILTLAAPLTSANVIFSQGFESDTTGWSDGGQYGAISQEASGTSGFASFEGSNHARVTQTDAGSFSNFSGVNDGTVFPNQAKVRTAIYLDTNMALGEGFDFSAALNPIGGGFLQDFIFHVTKDTSTGDLLVGGSNNTNFDPREDLENQNSFAVGNSGWYIFEHLFRNDGGQLAGDLNLYDATNNLLFTETRVANSYTFNDVGDVRYAWFTNIDVANGIAIDGFSLEHVEASAPFTLGLFAIALGFVARRKL